MKKYSLLVSLIALLGCEPREFDLYGDYQEPTEEMFIQEVIVVQETNVNNNIKKQGFDKKETAPKLQSHNKVKKPTAKKSGTSKKSVAKKTTAKKSAPKKVVAKKSVAKKSAPKKASVKKVCEEKTVCPKASQEIIKEVKIEPILSPEEMAQNEAIAKIRNDESKKFQKIWATKPVVMEGNGVSATVDDQIISALNYMSSSSNPICLSDPNLAFAKNSYKRILETSEGCCRNYISKSLQKTYGKPATYKFLTDDYNFYKAGELCMFYSDQDIANVFGTAQTWDIIKEARNQCGCLNKTSLQRDIKTLRIILDHKNLNRKSLVYKIKDEFNNYTYRNVYQDVLNLSNKLDNCSK